MKKLLPLKVKQGLVLLILIVFLIIGLLLTFGTLNDFNILAFITVKVIGIVLLTISVAILKGIIPTETAQLVVLIRVKQIWLDQLINSLSVLLLSPLVTYLLIKVSLPTNVSTTIFISHLTHLKETLITITVVITDTTLYNKVTNTTCELTRFKC